jgi:hypothetical protein
MKGAIAVTTIRTVVRDRRIEVPAPEELPDATEVLLTIGADVGDDDGPMTSEEIARVLVAMEQMQPMEMPDDVAAELDAWESDGKPLPSRVIHCLPPSSAASRPFTSFRR